MGTASRWRFVVGAVVAAIDSPVALALCQRADPARVVPDGRLGSHPARPQANPMPTAAEFLAYGQYPLIQLFFPTEKGQRAFLPDRKGPFAGNLRQYQTLWPPRWQTYAPIAQSYHAGQQGRTLLRIHGSGLGTGHFGGWRGPQGWQPTLGCLAARETYTDTPQHDMPRFLTQLAGDRFVGYVVVVDVPGPNAPVAIADLPLGLELGVE
ncbi:MAG: hypothetical protein HC918_03315 [Oscillatoriales cyanobacterium SM2_1_8]|nr:hypothetical protein [Oscillatoriales cyanobacterium SM2_1_8]